MKRENCGKEIQNDTEKVLCEKCKSLLRIRNKIISENPPSRNRAGFKGWLDSLGG